MVPAVGVLMLALAVTAVVSLARQKDLSGGLKLLCLLGILGFPVLGPAVWFFHLFRVRRRRPLDPHESPAIATGHAANRR
ncbi:PLDc N-terminal domain-containing protein [Arthrobacter gandavensis]|uniref:PLDc N-terminal domain-containing protein n=1 Tax=Arthrobacter gandavensis TaxID=169960 RepID=UPI001890736E|nr:PLDc N-terminal domain-containing protein [Arthrobacter gandavensis]MBF4993957.1 PLDc N-terminal domain-containing protein [Arthrobacter gandavensis]